MQLYVCVCMAVATPRLWLDFCAGAAHNVRPIGFSKVDLLPHAEAAGADFERVRSLIGQQRLFAAASGDAAAALALLEADLTDAGHIPAVLRRLTAASIRSMQLSDLVALQLAAVRAAGSHAAAADAVAALGKLTASEAGLQALAAGEWQAALQRLLSAAPNTQASANGLLCGFLLIVLFTSSKDQRAACRAINHQERSPE